MALPSRKSLENNNKEGRVMCVRPIITEEEVAPRYQNAAFKRRREVLRETVARLSKPEALEHYRAQGLANLQAWKRRARSRPPQLEVTVVNSDWGEAAQRLTMDSGEIPAVLNMANAYLPGGGYVEGCPAQEENMFRRTDCHFSLTEREMVPGLERYRPEKSDLLNAVGGRVYLDTERVRVCLRGPEARQREDLGYAWLREDEVFTFYELRASAQDLRDGSPFKVEDARRRIAAQLDTLIDGRLRHAVLSAFGCGAFRNPAPEVARLYREEFEARRDAFDHVVFAVFYPGYGPDNLGAFEQAFGGEKGWRNA
jgi:hypothetical protein